VELGAEASIVHADQKEGWGYTREGLKAAGALSGDGARTTKPRSTKEEKTMTCI
jgi:hypothetical protein